MRFRLAGSLGARRPVTHFRSAAWLLLPVCTLLCAHDALAFPHVVQAGDTLAALAERYYGRLQLERVVATANGLDRPGAPALEPGMLLEIPAVTYHQVRDGETWRTLAQTHLGKTERYIPLAEMNGHKPWLEPELGQVIRLPYNLPWRATGDESLATLAYRFLGSTRHAFRLVQYNQLGEHGPNPGQIMLLPLSELPLTAVGERAARSAAEMMTEQTQGARYLSQKNAEVLVRDLSQDVRGGRYLSAVQRGALLLGEGNLPTPGQAEVQRLLLEAFVALDAVSQARAACQAYLDLADQPELDPVMTSPKILQACTP